jgi:hypothetical protein
VALYPVNIFQPGEIFRVMSEKSNFEQETAQVIILARSNQNREVDIKQDIISGFVLAIEECDAAMNTYGNFPELHGKLIQLIENAVAGIYQASEC